MAKFQFRLATVLRLREAARDERRSQLAEALRALAMVEQKIGELDTELTGLLAAARTARGVIDVDRLLDGERYQLLLKAHRETLRRQSQTLEQEIEKRREALALADREVRVLERLKDHQLEAHRLDEERAAISHLDEVAGRRWLREE